MSSGPDCNETITILLSTFNGAAFLSDQLASLLRQTDPDWRLLWRDDGSHDASVAIMAAFSAAAGQSRCRRANAAAGRLGVSASFYALLAEAPSGPVAFCDQDDVWLPHKLARGRAALASADADRPMLYCARQILADAGLTRLKPSVALHQAPGFPTALTQNIATGCTVMLNAAALRLLQSAPPPPGTLHDWWGYLLVAAAGGRITVDAEPTLLYRQHGGNAVGAPNNTWSRAVAAVRRGPGTFMTVFRLHVDSLLGYSAVLTPAAVDHLRRLKSALRSGPLARLAVLRDPGLRRQTRLETILFRIWFLIG